MAKVEGAEEKKGEWKSEEGTQPEGVCCARCWTDAYVRFEMDGVGIVTVEVSVYKDLGEGKHPAEEKWVSLARGAGGKMPEEDFGRMKRLFDAAEEAEASAEEEAAGQGTENVAETLVAV